MPIRIKCPKCQTVLGVKETLAGKKANCPKCRHLLTIPVPKPKAEDVEALALSAFADEPPKAAPVAAKFIEFECPWCSEPVKMSAELAGKQAPCPNPECKRIVKVPLLKEDKPKDWRQVNPRGPGGALRKDDNEPTGAWGTAQATRVGTEALLEADAIPVKKEPVPVRVWVRRGVFAGVGALVVVALLVTVTVKYLNNRLWGPLNAAEAAAEQPNPKLSKAAVAELHRGVGEFYLMRGDARKAADHFGKCRSIFPEGKGLWSIKAVKAGHLLHGGPTVRIRLPPAASRL